MNMKLPAYKLVLTGGPGSWVPIEQSERMFLAAVSEDEPPTAAYILFTTLQFPARLKAQLRENLKQRNVQIIDQIEVTPTILEDVYADAEKITNPNSTDLDYERGQETVRMLLAKAVAESASDIHIVRRQMTALVSFRISGQVIRYAEWPDLLADQTCRFIYEVLGYDQAVTWNRHEPQDAIADTILSNGRKVRVRVGTIPASPDGYDMVLRILPGSEDIMYLNQLGYDADQIQAIQTIVQRPSGLLVMAGSVGSGKSTSMVSMLNEELAMHQSRLRIITVEDPPERVIPGATQVPVIRKKGNSGGDEFTFAIRGALRCDPDTLMVGEIRDLQSGLLTIKFAQSGHRVYTTVHASTALGIVGRLTGLGISTSLVCAPDVLKGLMFQSLVPKLCPECKISSEEWLNFGRENDYRRRESVQRASAAVIACGLDVSEIHYRGNRDCEQCGGSGVIGRTVMAEIVLPDDEMIFMLSKGDYHSARQHWLNDLNGRPVQLQGIQLIANGLVSPTDVEWQIGSLTTESAPKQKFISLPNSINHKSPAIYSY